MRRPRCRAGISPRATSWYARAREMPSRPAASVTVSTGFVSVIGPPREDLFHPQTGSGEAGGPSSNSLWPRPSETTGWETAGVADPDDPVAGLARDLDGLWSRA